MGLTDFFRKQEDLIQSALDACYFRRRVVDAREYVANNRDQILWERRLRAFNEKQIAQHRVVTHVEGIGPIQIGDVIILGFDPAPGKDFSTRYSGVAYWNHSNVAWEEGEVNEQWKRILSRVVKDKSRISYIEIWEALDREGVRRTSFNTMDARAVMTGLGWRESNVEYEEGYVRGFVR